MAVVQVSFNPSLWTAGFGTAGQPGSNGYNAFTVVPDQDGTTAWALEYFGAGFARFNKTTGSIVHQDAIFGVPGSTHQWWNKEDGTAMFVQDDQGHYYTMPDQSSGGGDPHILYKSHVGSGTAGNLFNGYMIDDATINLKSTIFSDANFLQCYNWSTPIKPASDGNRYLALTTDAASCGVVNVATMAVEGKFTLNYANAGNFVTIGSVATIGVVNFAPGYANITITGTFTNIAAGDWISLTGITDPNLTFLNNNQFAVPLTSANSTTLVANDVYVAGNDATYGPVSALGSTVYINATVRSFATFMDKNGDFWFAYNSGRPISYAGTFPSWGCYLVKWHPADGATAGVLNCTVNFVSAGTMGTGTNGIQFAGYVPANHSVFLGNTIADTGQSLNVSLTTFARNAFHADDLSFFFNGQFDTPESALNVGVQTSGYLGIPGSAYPITNNSSYGGLLNDIDPVTMTAIVSTDVTALVIAAGYLAGGTFFDHHSSTTPYCPIGTMAYSETLNKVVVAYEFVGSAVYIVDTTVPPPPPPPPPPFGIIKVEGYLLTSQVDAKSALMNLMAAFFLDVVESDFILHFIPRGMNPSVMTIPEVDLGIQADKAKLIETQVMPQELPRFVDVIYVDPTLDWQQNKQHKHRSSRVIKTKQALSMSLPIVLDADAARQIAEKALYLAWLERKPWSMNLFRPSYMVLDPADTVSFVYQNVTYTMRVTGNTIGVNYGLQLQGVSEDQNNYTSVTTGGTDSAITTSTPTPLFPTFLFLRDLPYLQDSDAISDRSQTGYYVGMSAADSRWVGGVLYRSSDDTNFDAVDSSTARMWYGQATNTLGDPPSLWTWDNTNVLNITVPDSMNFVFSGTTDFNVLNGANVMIVGNEVIQYVNAVQTSPGNYTLSRLLRGRRNTEQFAYGHGANEQVFDPTTGLKREATPLALIGLERFYRGVTVGANITTVADTDLTIEANDLKPAFPVQITGTRSTGDLIINWLRRTRYAGDWLNNTANVPLNEDTEAYEIDVLNGMTVVRTITGLTTPTALYTATQQIADFGSVQSAVSISVYQISAEVGRGFPSAAKI